MKTQTLQSKLTAGFLTLAMTFVSVITIGQTNVYDDVIATSPNHTSLAAALQQEGLDVVLQNQNASFTVFAPDNDAFDDLASELGVTIPQLLMLPDLDSILLYHVLGIEVSSMMISNGDIVQPVTQMNNLKLTVTSNSDVFVNQAQVNAANLTADNGVVHSLDAVLLPAETVADVAIDNGFSTLVTAAVTAELLPALTNPFADLTVFAPSNDAFDDVVADLGISINDLLADPNLADILLYHVLDGSVASSAINNGDIVTPLNAGNTLKLTVTSNSEVFVNQAEVELADVMAENGVVHAIDAVVLPNETVADVAIDNNFNTLVTAVVTAELLPALTDPFADWTVFAPSDAAFNDAIAELGITVNDLLADPDLADILLYHVLDGSVESGMISNGDIVTPVNADNTLKFTVTSNSEVFVNQAQVELADVTASNGVVHAINEVVLPNETVADVAIDNGFTTLTTAVVTAELLPALTDPFEEYTVFAPTDSAFDVLAADLGTDLAGILALPNLADILLYHVVDGEVLSTQLSNGTVTTLSGGDLTVNIDNGVMINSSNVTLADVTADNGVVHVIDEVLLDIPTGVENVSSEELTFYPNPVQDFIRVQNISNTASFEVFSIDGSLVKTGVVNGSEINMSDLQPGTYMIRVEDESNFTQGTLIKL